MSSGEPRDLGEVVNEARKLVLAAEQPLLRMVAQRKASIAALELAARNYVRAAELLTEAAVRLTQRKVPQGEPDQ